MWYAANNSGTQIPSSSLSSNPFIEPSWDLGKTHSLLHTSIFYLSNGEISLGQNFSKCAPYNICSMKSSTKGDFIAKLFEILNIIPFSSKVIKPIRILNGKSWKS